VARHNGSTDRSRQRFVPQRPKYESKRSGTYVPNILVVRCLTGKQGFTQAVAQSKLEAYAEGVDNRATRPKRIYLCPSCGAWHLTSQETYP
jgi:hypothetical protein